MKATLYYAAYSYLDEWMWRDSRFNQALRYETSLEVPTDLGICKLAEVAKYYGVARTLKKINGEPRLEAAYMALLQTRLSEGCEVVELVEHFTDTLHALYGSYALSAASKFLWMRFRSPIVIYDSKASKWLCRNPEYRDDSYANYYKCWHNEYSKHEEQIVEACAELKEPAIKKFTLACGAGNDELAEWTGSRWFRERVFDHFMLAQIDLHEENDSRGSLG